MEQINCGKCVLHSRVPGVTINENGICSKCENHSSDAKVSQKMSKYFSIKLNNLLAKVKEERHPYDAVVLFSGGKDSTFLLKLVKEQYGLKPLAFAVAHPLFTDNASKNVETVAQKLGVDLFKFHPQEAIYKKFLKYALLEGYKYGMDEYIGCNACSFIFKNSALMTAIKMDIPIVFDGCDVDQSDTPIFIEAEKMKADAANGTGPYGKMHRIFLDALGDDFRHSFYDFNYQDLQNYNFPSFVSPFTFIDYNFKNNFKIFEEMGLNSKSFKTIFTNCVAVPFFSYFSIKRFDCLTYIKHYANEVRNGYPYFLQSKLEIDENVKALSKEVIETLMAEYKEVVLYVVNNKISKDTFTPDEKAKIYHMASTHLKIYGPEVCGNFFEQVLMVNYWGKFFEIDLLEI